MNWNCAIVMHNSLNISLRINIMKLQLHVGISRLQKGNLHFLKNMISLIFSKIHHVLKEEAGHLKSIFHIHIYVIVLENVLMNKNKIIPLIMRIHFSYDCTWKQWVYNLSDHKSGKDKNYFKLLFKKNHIFIISNAEISLY